MQLEKGFAKDCMNTNVLMYECECVFESEPKRNRRGKLITSKCISPCLLSIRNQLMRDEAAMQFSES